MNPADQSEQRTDTRVSTQRPDLTPVSIATADSDLLIVPAAAKWPGGAVAELAPRGSIAPITATGIGMRNRRYGYQVDERACATLGGDPSQRTVFALTSSPAVFISGASLSDRIVEVSASSMAIDSPLTPAQLVSAHIGSTDEIARSKLPPGFAYAGLCDLESGNDPLYGVIRIDDLDVVLE